MAERIEKPGDYQVTIREPYWQLAGRDGEDKMSLVLPGVVEIDGAERSINAYLYFVPTLYASGRNAGRAVWDVNAETCVQLGMSEPFDPTQFEQLNGAMAKYVVEEEEYEGKKRMKVKFVNAPGRERLTNDRVAEIWAVLSDGDAPVAKPVETVAKAEEDDIPF